MSDVGTARPAWIPSVRRINFGAVLDLPVRRPVAVSMVYLGIVLLGVVGWQRMPVELFPNLSGDALTVSFNRPGSEPHVVEREILLPLHARVSGLPLVAESWGQVRGAGGSYRVRFEPSADIKVRQLELGRIAAAIQREQPRNTSINVSANDASAFGTFVMTIHIIGGDGDRNALHDLVEELIAPRFAAVPGVSEALVSGGAERQVLVRVNPARTAAFGVTTDEVIAAVQRNVGRLAYLGNLEDENGRTDVVLDGRPASLAALAEVRIAAGKEVKLRHVAELEHGTARASSLFRVNAAPAVGVYIFQEDTANLVRLGEELRDRVALLREELRPLGLDLVIGSDAAEEVEEQLGRLVRLGATGYLIALGVLFLFLRQWRAVAVVGVAVPISLLGALALLFLLGQTLNLISLLGLTLAVGLLVDNSVVVYEATQRGLERGAAPADAVRRGLGRTARAIVAASLTTAVVFLVLVLVPVSSPQFRTLFEIVAIAFLLPLGSSLFVALGLVPLLAHRLASSAAVREVQAGRARREAQGGLRRPNPARLYFTGVVAGALRRPAGWVAGVVLAFLVTLLIAVPWVLVRTGASPAAETDSVELVARFRAGASSVQAMSGAVERIERAVLAIEGVETVEARIEEDGASITVHLLDEGERPPTANAARVRDVAESASRDGLYLLRPGEGEFERDGGGGDGQGIEGGPARIVLSGPDSRTLERLARDVRLRLESVPWVDEAWPGVSSGMEEIWVQPNRRAFEALGLTLDDVLPVLQLAGREGQRNRNGYVLPSGREVPVVVERAGARDSALGLGDVASMRVTTESGVFPVVALAEVQRMPPQPTIAHYNGRRERSVFYTLDREAPETGPARVAIEADIADAVRAVSRPDGYTVEVGDAEEESTSDWLRSILVPTVLLLFLLLAMTFESLTMPVLVLLALPLTLLGAAWILVISDTPLGFTSVLGALVLFGLTVNPAILLVDRMQRKALDAGWSAGAAAFSAVCERTRPVLMTSATTIASLWPLALVTGRENEMWPPFATIVIGGLVTSTLLTLLVIPVGYILLRRLDVLFGRVGPWLMVGWLGATAAVIAPLILAEVLVSVLWQVVVTLLAGGALLAVAVLLFRRPDRIEPDCSAGPPPLEVRYLHKVYGLPGPLRRAVRAPRDFVNAVRARGGEPVAGAEAAARLLPLALLAAGSLALAVNVQGGAWKLVFVLLGSSFLAQGFRSVRVWRIGHAAAAAASGVEGLLAALTPWLALVGYVLALVAMPLLAGEAARASLIWPAFGAVALAVVQLARRSAVRQQRGLLPPRVQDGALRHPRTLLRGWARRLAGLDLPLEQVTALASVAFRIERGMVGILGPNGAGKTTLLRQLAGILDPTRGAIRLGGAPLPRIQRHLARWVGYLPQDSGLPAGMSPREYLLYFAALYDIQPRERTGRVEYLLREVGLADKVDDRIGSLSGGMRQRVAVARTLLRLPPVIMVDEPTAGLDPRERIRFRNLLASLARERIVLFSTHVVEDVAVACERVLVLARGRLVFDGVPAELAEVADGRAWEVAAPADADFALPAGAVLAEEAPGEPGMVKRRILADAPPSADARAIEAGLEDGYLWLIGNTRGSKPEAEVHDVPAMADDDATPLPRGAPA